MVNLTNMRVSVSLDSDNAEETINSQAKEYLSKFKEDVLVPKREIFVWPASTNFSVSNGITICEENAFMLSKLTKKEFLTLIDSLALEKTPNLFEFWHDAFSYKNINNAFRGWNVTKAPDEYTYYGKNSNLQIEIAARYENDRAFIRTQAQATRTTDEKRKWTGTRVLER